MASVTVSRNQVAPGTGTVVDADGRQIALFNVGGTFYAIDNACRHMGGPLGEGTLEGTTVTCPWHAWEYDVTTGACETTPIAAVPKYPVRVEGDNVVIEVP